MSVNHDALPRRVWRRVRRTILDRDGWRCVKCGRAGRLEVDHIQPLEQGGAPLDPDNLQTLCIDCHIGKTDGERNIPKEVRKWREFLRETRLREI